MRIATWGAAPLNIPSGSVSLATMCLSCYSLVQHLCAVSWVGEVDYQLFRCSVLLGASCHMSVTGRASNRQLMAAELRSRSGRFACEDFIKGLSCGYFHTVVSVALAETLVLERANIRWDIRVGRTQRGDSTSNNRLAYNQFFEISISFQGVPIIMILPYYHLEFQHPGGRQWPSNFSWMQLCSYLASVQMVWYIHMKWILDLYDLSMNI